MRRKRYLAAGLLLLFLAGCKAAGTGIQPDAGYLPSAAAVSTIETAAADASTMVEPSFNVLNVRMDSPDGRFRAESYGVNTGVTSGGLYPAEGIRLVELSTGKIMWKMLGYYNTAFLWSSDSRYLAVSYKARTDGGTVIVDTTNFSETAVPIPPDMREKMRSYRADPYLSAAEWINVSSIKIAFQWIGSDEQSYTGTFVFEPLSVQVSDIVVSSELVG